ncbi:MAG: YciI family protein [Microbacteriaceae bacterium]
MAVYAVQYHYQENSDAQKDEYRPSHREWLSGQFEAGRLLASGPFVGVSGALLIWKANSADELRELLAHDPFSVQNLIAQTDVTEWTNFFGPWAS